jgi:hypothetical protein
MIKFLVVEPTYLDSNFRFDVGVTHLQLIILLVVCDIIIDSDVLFDRFYESQD